MTNLTEERKKTIEQMVEDYYAQVRIVQKTDMTLSEYLKGIGLKDSDLQHAYEYNALRKDTSFKQLDGVTTIQLSRSTKKELDVVKISGESYDDVVKRLVSLAKWNNE